MQKSAINRFLSIVLPSILIILLSSCNQQNLIDENIAIAEKGWDHNQRASFEVMVDDSLSLHAFYINIRQQENYRYSNLYVFLHTTFPNGTTTHDTIECVLAQADGRWLGKSTGSLISNQILLNPSLRFPLAGKYRFEIEQAMRETTLKGIRDIGIRIEKKN